MFVNHPEKHKFCFSFLSGCFFLFCYTVVFVFNTLVTQLLTHPYSGGDDDDDDVDEEDV